MRVLGYTRVSTDEQATSGYGLAAQEERIREAALLRGYELAGICREEGASAKSLERPELQQALRLIAAGDVDGLIVAKLDRLTRSVLDFATLMEWFANAGAALIVLDLQIDTTTPAGEAMAHVMATFAQFERRLISQRTKDGLAQARANGKVLGRGGVSDRPELVERIREMHARGLSQREIADTLNWELVPTIRGAFLWRQSAVQTVLGYKRRPPRREVSLPEVRRRVRHERSDQT